MVSAATVLHWRRTTCRLVLFVCDSALAETMVATEMLKHRGSGDGGRKIGSGGSDDGGRNRGGGWKEQRRRLRWRQHWLWHRQTAAATAGAGTSGGRREQRQWRGQTTINKKAAVKAAEMVIVVATEMVMTETAAAETNIRFPVTRILKSLPTYIVSLFVYL